MAVYHLGLDIGVRRDSTALAAIYYNRDWGAYILHGHRLWTPEYGEVRIQDATDAILSLCKSGHVASLWYDEYQYMSEAQRIREAGFGRILKPVNQQTENVAFSNALKSHIDTGDFLMYPDAAIRMHFSWCNVEVTERGWRITKRKQTRQIDMVVAIAMALYGCAQSKDYQADVFQESRHSRSLQAMA